MSSSTNSWLHSQKKAELVDVAQHVNLKGIKDLKKSDLEAALDEFLGGHSTQYSSDPVTAGYYNSRSRTIGSPVKKEAPELKVSRRRATKASQDEIVAADDEPVSTALARTPGRALSLASRIPLPASPADVAQVVDRQTVAIRQRVASMYADSGITEVTHTTRDALSTVTSVLFAINAFELYCLRSEVLPGRYAFTIPAIGFLGTADYPVSVPDMFLLLTADFWSPALTWAFTSIILPSLFGYFFNLSAASHPARGRPTTRAMSQHQPEYAVDPLTFSIVKAVVTYVVYAQGITFGGWVDQLSVARINSALFQGWQGAITGSLITGLAALYDAILKK